MRLATSFILCMVSLCSPAIAQKTVAITPKTVVGSNDYWYQTTLEAMKKPYGVGCIESHLFVEYKINCPEWAKLGDENFGVYQWRAWAIFNTKWFRGDGLVVIREVKINNFFEPSSDPDHRTQFRRLNNNLRYVSAASVCWDLLQDYVYETIDTPPTQRAEETRLGPVAQDDFQSAIITRTWFGIGITEDGDSDGMAEIAGYDIGYPQLIVTWSYPAPVENTTWGRIKALYR